MGKVKNVVAVAIMLVAGSAMASNFRAADQVYVPVAGHAAGSSGTFISDVFISNLSTDSVSVSVIFSTGAGGTQTPFNNAITLGPSERKEILDFFPTVLGLSSGLGQLIFNGCKQGGNCDVTTCPNGATTGVCPDFRNISVESRIYSIPPGANQATAPTTGQLFRSPSCRLTPPPSASTRSSSPDCEITARIAATSAWSASQYSTTTLLVSFQRNQWRRSAGRSQTSRRSARQQNIGNMFPAFPGDCNQRVHHHRTDEHDADRRRVRERLRERLPGVLCLWLVLDNQSGDATTSSRSTPGNSQPPRSTASTTAPAARARSTCTVRSSTNAFLIGI